MTRAAAKASKGSSSSSTGRQASESTKTSPWEWAVAAVGALLIASALGYMTFYGLTHPSTPPEVSVEVRSVSPVSAGFLVEFEVANGGNSTAASLTITGELRSGESVVETRQTTLDYLPEQSNQRGGLFFQNDPEQYDLNIRAEGLS